VRARGTRWRQSHTGQKPCKSWASTPIQLRPHSPSASSTNLLPPATSSSFRRLSTRTTQVPTPTGTLSTTASSTPLSSPWTSRSSGTTKPLEDRSLQGLPTASPPQTLPYSVVFLMPATSSGFTSSTCIASQLTFAQISNVLSWTTQPFEAASVTYSSPSSRQMSATTITTTAITFMNLSPCQVTPTADDCRLPRPAMRSRRHDFAHGNGAEHHELLSWRYNLLFIRRELPATEIL